MKRLLIGFYLTIAIMVIITLIIVVSRLSQETIELIGLAILACFVFAIAGIFILFGAAIKQGVRFIRARIDSVEFEAKSKRYEIHKDGFGMLYMLDLKTQLVENWSTFPGSHHNGVWEKPDPMAVQAWHALVGRRQNDELVKQLPQSDTEDNPESLFDLLDNYPHVMVVGGTGSGKTTVLCHCAEYRYRQDKRSRIVWLSTHAAKDNDDGVIHPKAHAIQDGISQALGDIYRTYCKWRDGAKKPASIVLVLDEWPEIIYANKELGEMLRLLAQGGRKFGMSLILGSHGSNVGDLGITGHSAVKSSFAEIYLNSKLTQRNAAVWQPFNKNSRVEISLPGLFQGGNARVLALAEQPTDYERKVLRLHEQGLKPTAISEKLKGWAKGETTREIAEIIAKWQP